MTGVVAIDGPGGSGKSTVSRLVGARLGWAHLDTGAFYRMVALAVLRAGCSPEDTEGVVDVVDRTGFALEDGRAFLDGVEVTTDIRGVEVTAIVSAVSAIPAVRTRMVDLQRRWVSEHGATVVEGRDIGTVVFPDALVKIFLTADPAERARRRARDEGREELAVAGDLAARDRIDSSRSVSPLRAAPDAVVIDTTDLEAGDVVERILALVAQATENGGVFRPGVSG